MAWASRIKQSAALGLAAGVALVLLLSAWLQGSADADIAAQQKQREAVLLANAISASLAGAPEEAINERLQRWQAGNPAVQSVLVIAGRQLLGSTRAEDQAPRALQREEKPLFDLAGALRAAGETNTGEGLSLIHI